MRQVKILSDQEVQRIHSGSLKVLYTPGIIVPSERARKLLEEAGAEVNHEAALVRLPSEIVEQSIEKAPGKIIYGGRDPKRDLVLERGGATYFRPSQGHEGWIDLETRQYRNVTMPDVKNWIRLADALDNMAYCTGIYPPDVPVEMRDIHILRLLLENTDKHTTMLHPYNTKSMEYMIELLLVDRGGEEELKKRPRFSTTIDTVSPLTFTEYGIDLMFLSGKYGIPCELNAMSISGGTSPVTLAGALVIGHAELLALLTMAQLANPGAPVSYKLLPMTLDMSTGVGLKGSVEFAMLVTAGVQLAQECCGIPSVVAPGTDSLAADGQAIIEKIFTILGTVQAGTNVVCLGGGLEHSYTGDLVQMVIDNEISGMVHRWLRGIEVNDDTLGLDVIAQVGAGGNFLTNDHTLKYFRTEHHMPDLAYRKARAIWDTEEIKDFSERGKQKAITLLKDHEPVPLAEDVKKEFDSIVERAEKDEELRSLGYGR